MSTIQVQHLSNIQSILKENNLQSYRVVDLSVGNDDKIYCLIAKNVPENSPPPKYKAISFTVDWQEGEFYWSEIIDFGLLRRRYHFLQPIGEFFLLLNARARTETKNALIVDKYGSFVNSFCLGDGIQSCIVDSQNNIITSYFDEGALGGGEYASCGVVKCSETGEKLWGNSKYDICDCYAMNIDEQNNLWFYYYTDFNLVKTDYQSDTVFTPNVAGAQGFLISKYQNALLFHKGYGKKGFCITKRNHKNFQQLSKPVDVSIVCKDEKINITDFAFRSSKAVFATKSGNLYFTDWDYE
jgi:hypothetical protein